MRIIAGLAKGIRLTAPDGRGVRPTEDRVKESMFSTLGDLRGLVVLDLFSGSGALGLEALSRGAGRVVFVEQNRQHFAFIRKNYEAVVKSIGSGAGEAEFYTVDARQIHSMLPHLAGQINIVLADPPYETQKNGYGSHELIKDTQLASILAQDCILAIEHAAANVLPWEESAWELIRERQYGIRAVSFARLKHA